MAALSANATPTPTFTTSFPPPWIPEDDLLLKNAIEAGASLEALARGAVRFSKKFSVRELRDRWYALLYDDEVSSEASSRMVELELSNFSLSKVNNNNNVSKFGAGVKESDSVKRKFQCVRQLYFAMSKKTRRQDGGGCGDFGFLDSPDGGNAAAGIGDVEFGGTSGFGEDDRGGFGFRGDQGGIEGVHFERDNVGNDMRDVGDGTVEFQNSERSKKGWTHGVPGTGALDHAEGIESLAPREPLWKTMEDVSAPEMLVSVGVEDKGHRGEEILVNHDDVDGNKMSLLELADHSGVTLLDKTTFNVVDRSTAISECDLRDISDALLNFPNEDEPLLMDVDGKDAIDQSCNDCITASLFVNSNNNIQGDVLGVKDPGMLASDATFEITDGECPTVLEVIPEHSVGDDQDSHKMSDTNEPSSTSAPNNPYAEESGEMECMFNTEDSEIPCNDDVFLAKTSSFPIVEQTSNKAHHLPFSRTNQLDCKQELVLLKKEENPVECLTSPRMVGQTMFPINSPKHQLVRCGAKCESPILISKPVIDACVDPRKGRVAMGTPIPLTSELLKLESLHENLSFPTKAISVPDEDPSTSNQEESGIDGDIPCFADIEAMILEMDLCPEDSDCLVDSDVSRYQNEDAKTAIIRLEQCARSSMQRAIASRGALAILYGRHLKHYIKETKVMLGRATGDMDVDIDLGREGPANKISRRQALIKMEGDGSFFLKNLGKNPIFLNGKELSKGQSMGLKSSSLIEIKEMAFVFEINSKSVRRYLADVTKNHHDNIFKFEC